jgi:hypothetical protein
MNIYLKAFRMKSVLSVHAQMIFKFLAYLVREKNKYKFLLAFLKKLTNSNNCTERCIKFLFRLSFAVLGLFSFVYTVHSWQAFRTIFIITAVFQNNFRVAGGYLKDGTTSMKGVTGRIFTISM